MSRFDFKKHRLQRSSRRSAFTLLEVLLVLAILVVVGSVAVSTYMGSFEVAKERITKTALSETKNVINVYLIDIGQLPGTLEDLVSQPQGLEDVSKWKKPYLAKIPTDGWERPLIYEPDTQNETFRVYSAGKNGTAGDGDDIEVK